MTIDVLKVNSSSQEITSTNELDDLGKKIVALLSKIYDCKKTIVELDSMIETLRGRLSLADGGVRSNALEGPLEKELSELEKEKANKMSIIESLKSRLNVE
jgi:peptidoglycan hydrolase CwlO-like protein